MLVVKNEFAHSRYGGVHPLTGADLSKVLWKDLPQDVLLHIYSDERNRVNIFDSISEIPTQAIKEQPNVNTTAPNTSTTRITTTTAKASTGTITE